MSDFFDLHRPTLEAAVAALASRAYWTPYPEVPSGKVYGETAKADGEAAFAALQGAEFDLPGHPGQGRAGAEVSPFGPTLSIRYPAATPDDLIAAATSAAPALAAASVEARVGVCLEALARLNRQSFLIGNATMHTTGQAFAMAFQAGGPHAQDRGLEAVAAAYAEMTRFAAHARWEKPQGKAAPIVMEKSWTLRPAGIALTIGCNTFPTWNSYPGLFASLATGNPVIVKPHPRAILPLALTVRVLREVLVEAGLPADAVLLAVDEPGAEITKTLAIRPEVKLIDYTGSSTFGTWLRDNARQAQLFTEETGVNSVVIAAADDFDGMCANLAFSLSLYSGQMCTAPQNIYVPQDGIRTDQGRVVRDGTPLLLAVEADAPVAQDECFGPVAFLIRCADADDGIARAADLAAAKGAITAALYDTDDARIRRAVAAFARAGVNLSVNLTGNIFVNQSAAFSDFHVTGANPAGNASLTDTAFVATRFRRVMWRRPAAAPA